jgi:membrane dipeptidase
VQMAGSMKELDAILSQPKGQRPIAAVHAVEGAHSLGLDQTSLEGALRNVEALFNRGVVSITLAHFYPNLVVHPTYPFPDDVAKLSVHPGMWRDLTKGLTDIGKKVVEKMIELGMFMDLSHSTPAARKEIYDIIDATGKRVPLFATHVGAYELDPTPYNLTDWEIKRVARDGGVIGVIFMPYWLMPKEGAQGLNFVARHMQYLVDMGGEDCVGIGTDFDGFATPPDDLDNASRMPRLTQRLVADGHPADRVKKILGGNAIRALREGWGKK